MNTEEMELMELELNEILESMGITVDSRNGYAHNHYGNDNGDPKDYWDDYGWND